jgi:hypothetical protein
MDWNEAQGRIQTNIKVRTDVNSPDSTYRFVKSVDNERGFVVPIGRDNSIRIPWSMLEKCFNQLSCGFNKASFEEAFPSYCNLQGNAHKGCYIHVIGQMFVKAGVARCEKEGRRTTFYLRGNS